MHYTLPPLMALDERFPTQRKLLLVPSINLGRELLAALAHQRGSWVGWETTTLAAIAQKLAVVELARCGLRRSSDVAIAESVSAAFDVCIARGHVSDTLAGLGWSAGTRTAIVDAVLELRSAGVDAAMLRSVGAIGVSSSLAAVMAEFDSARYTHRLADSTEVFAAALAAFDEQAPFVLDHSLMVCVPGWTARGSSRRLLELLVGRGLQSLPPLRHPDLMPPAELVERRVPVVETAEEVNVTSASTAMFCAGTPADELREILRRAVSGGAALDDVEVACTDPETYCIEFEALAQQLGATYTSLDGISYQLTRIGRAVERWFSWLESDYSAEHIRGAIESGDWQVAGDSADIAAELRRLQIGWGLPATRRARARLTATSHRARIEPYDDETSDHFAHRRDKRHVAMDGLAGVLDTLLEHAPLMRGASGDGAPISVPALAEQTMAVMRAFIIARTPAEESTMQRIMERLQQIGAVPRDVISPANALATLRQDLTSLRAWTDASQTRRPRRSTGGHLHLTNIESAGATGRSLQFIVGLDADRSSGPVMQSPLLPDSLRNKLNERGAELATTEQRRREAAWKLANAVGASTSALTLSYAVQGAADGREGGPAPALLQAARDLHDNPALTYDEFRGLLGPAVSPIPATVSSAIDDRDVWLANMVDGPLLLDAERVARAHFPGLERGLQAKAEREGDAVGAFHGLVPAAGRLDPRKTGRPISPSSLETIAACSLRWFYAYALDARTPEEPLYDPLVWLNALDRGRVLHAIYERVVRERLYEAPDSVDRRERTTRIVHDEARRIEADIPVPNDAVRTRELQALLNDALLFVFSEHDAFVREPWEVAALESTFGGTEPAVVPLDDGTQLLVRGRVDRVDRMRDGTLRLVDYKTGRSFVLDAKRGSFDGGRKLQLAVYSPAIAAQLDAVVSVAEYRFPTERGEGEVARAGTDLLEAAPRIVRSLLDDVAEGRFVPTIDKSDCAFCEYAAICRTTRTRFSHDSPRATWASDHSENSPHFAGVLTRKKSGESA